MRLLLSFLLLPAVALAAKSATPREQLVALAAQNNGVIKLDSQTFDLITNADRDWSAVVQLTALGQNMKCAPCREFAPSFTTVGQAWRKAPADERDHTFFATLDFNDGMDVFRRLGINSAPIVTFYPATKGPRRPASGKTDPIGYDFNSNGFDPASLATSLSRHLPIPIPYSPPKDYSFLITVVTAVVTLAAMGRFFLPILTSRWTWAAITIMSSIIFTSGLMFTRIRGVPYVAAGRDGKVSWMAGGYQNQYGMEVHVLTALYTTLAFAHFALIVLVPRIPSPSRQRVAVYVWTGVIFILFSVLLSFFRVKNGGYPFKLFF